MDVTYHTYQTVFAWIDNKGLSYVIQKSLGQSHHKYNQQPDTNAMYIFLQTNPCMNISSTEKTYYSALL